MTTYPLRPLGEVLEPDVDSVLVEPAGTYSMAGIYSFGRGVFARGPIAGTDTRYTSLNRLRAGQFVISRLKAFEGAVAVVPPKFDGWFLSQEFPTFSLTDRADVKFMEYLCQWPDLWQSLQRASKGVGARRERVHPEKLLTIEVPLPAVDEQRRVAGRLSNLLASVKGVFSLQAEAEPKVKSLAGSFAAREFEALAYAKRQAIEEFAEVRGGIQKGQHRTPVSHPVRYLTVAHVKRDEVSLEDPRYFEVAPDELERWKLLPGDVLIIEGNGSPSQIGRTALFRGEIEPCVHQNHVIRMRTAPEAVDPEYLNAFLNSPMGQLEAQSRGRTTSGLLSLSVGRIKQIEVPVPGLEDQREVVTRVNAGRERASHLGRLVDAGRSRLEALEKSVLNRAFAGGL